VINDTVDKMQAMKGKLIALKYYIVYNGVSFNILKQDCIFTDWRRTARIIVLQKIFYFFYFIFFKVYFCFVLLLFAQKIIQQKTRFEEYPKFCIVVLYESFFTPIKASIYIYKSIIERRIIK